MDKKLALLTAILAMSTGLVFAQMDEPAANTETENTEITNVEEGDELLNEELTNEEAEVEGVEEGTVSGTTAQ